jgi:ketosteroid isomerase-like protein
MVSRIPLLLGCALLLAFGAPAAAGSPGSAAIQSGSPDEVALRQVNADYIRGYLNSDVARLRRLIADDFRGVLASGRVIDKGEFLKEAGIPPEVREFRLKDVAIRIYGDAAIVGAEVSYRRPDGAPVQTRYVDVYVRRADGWQLVSAQWTRVAQP